MRIDIAIREHEPLAVREEHEGHAELCGMVQPLLSPGEGIDSGPLRLDDGERSATAIA
jgi:hypothetical protein